VGASGYKTSVGKHRLGCRMPYEYSDIGDGYASSGPVVEYKLSPEEIKRKYGAPSAPREHKRQRLTKEYLMEHLKKQTVGQIAERHHVPQEIVFKMCEKFGLELDKKNRIKEGDDMGSVMKLARKFLPVEVLGVKLAQGETYKAIAGEHGLPPWVIQELKRQYWKSGFKPEEYIQPETPMNQDESCFAKQELVMGDTYIPEEIINIEPGIQQLPEPKLNITWSTTRHGKNRINMSLQIKVDRTVISAGAVNEIKHCKFVKIGVDDDGNIYIAPAITEDECTYKISANSKGKNSNAKIGGALLIKFLTKHGFNVGEGYELTKLENGWLMATRPIVRG